MLSGFPSSSTDWQGSPGVGPRLGLLPVLHESPLQAAYQALSARPSSPRCCPRVPSKETVPLPPCRPCSAENSDHSTVLSSVPDRSSEKRYVNPTCTQCEVRYMEGCHQPVLHVVRGNAGSAVRLSQQLSNRLSRKGHREPVDAGSALQATLGG